MFKGKGKLVYLFFKVGFYIIGCWEYSLSEYEHPGMFVLLISILIINSFIRQFLLYEKDSLFRYGKLSIIFEFILGTVIASVQRVAPVVLLLTPTVFEAMAVYSLIFGSIISMVSLASLVTLSASTVLTNRWIYNIGLFMRSVFLSYGLAYFLIAAISYIAGMQFRERERIAKSNRELESAYKQLLDNASRLQKLSIEEERNRMAREIHDTLAHTLTAAVVQMEACKKLISIDTARAREEIEKAQELTRDGLSDVKRTIKALRPQLLENGSFADALFNLAHGVEESTGMKIILHCDMLQELKLKSGQEVALFRVIQESVTNAVRHGAAGQTDISIYLKDEMLYIDISDNGKGCASIREGYGLKGIAERIRGLGGNLRYLSSPGRGFETKIAVPYKGGLAYEDQSDDR